MGTPRREKHLQGQRRARTHSSPTVSLNSACETGKQPERAMVSSDNMHPQHIVPNVITYNALMSACEKGDQPQTALAVFQEMQQQGVLPDVVYL